MVTIRQYLHQQLTQLQLLITSNHIANNITNSVTNYSDKYYLFTGQQYHQLLLTYNKSTLLPQVTMQLLTTFVGEYIKEGLCVTLCQDQYYYRSITDPRLPENSGNMVSGVCGEEEGNNGSRRCEGWRMFYTQPPPICLICSTAKARMCPWGNRTANYLSSSHCFPRRQYRPYLDKAQRIIMQTLSSGSICEQRQWGCFSSCQKKKNFLS